MCLNKHTFRYYKKDKRGETMKVFQALKEKGNKKDKISVSGYGYLHIPYGLKITWTFDDKSTFVFDNTQNTKQCLYA